MNDREHSADGALRGQGRRGRGGGGGVVASAAMTGTARPVLGASQVDDHRERAKDPRTGFQHTRAGTKRIHDQQCSQRRLLIKETKQSIETSPDLLMPHRRSDTRESLARKEARAVDSVLEYRQETVLAPREEIVERAPRNTRARNNTRNSRPASTVIRYDTRHSRENPSALHLTHTRMRDG